MNPLEVLLAQTFQCSEAASATRLPPVAFTEGVSGNIGPDTLFTKIWERHPSRGGACGSAPLGDQFAVYGTSIYFGSQ